MAGDWDPTLEPGSWAALFNALPGWLLVLIAAGLLFVMAVCILVLFQIVTGVRL